MRINHVYREANRLADELANYPFYLSLDFHMLLSIPLDVDLLLREDMSGSSRPRQVAM